MMIIHIVPYIVIGLSVLGILFVLGVYLAKISDESMIRYGIQMLFVGLITALLCVATSILLGGSVTA